MSEGYSSAVFDNHTARESALSEERLFRQQYGGKALGLVRLKSHENALGYTVPPFSLISTCFFDAFMTAYSQRYGHNFNNFSYLAERVEFPEPEKKMLQKIYEDVYDPYQPLVIRSSSVLEDQDDHQFKGIYHSEFLYPNSSDTFMNMGFENFLKAVKKVFGSIYSQRAIDYREQHGLGDDKMALVIMPVVGRGFDNPYGDFWTPAVSGVTLHTPYQPQTVISEINIGLNTKTVQGQYDWRSAYSTTQGHSLAGTGYGSDAREESYGQHQVLNKYGIWANSFDGFPYIREYLIMQGLNPDNRGFEKKYMRKLFEIAQFLKSHYGVPIELEWSIDWKGELNIYQLRLLSYDQFYEQAKKNPVKIEEVPHNRLVTQTEITSGHGEVLLPLKSYNTYDDMSSYQNTQYGDCIAVIPLTVLTKDHFDLSCSQLMEYGKRIKAVILIGGNIPLGAHWAEFFISQNIPVVCVQSMSDINTQILDDYKIPERHNPKLWHTIIPFRLAVDGIKGIGQVHLP